MMPYPHHEIRTVIDLNDLWDFPFLGAVDPTAVTPARSAQQQREVFARQVADQAVVLRDDRVGQRAF